MKKHNWILLMAFATSLRAAEAPQTNSPAAGTNEPPAAKVEAATIPDATHKPGCTTNTVAIAGWRDLVCPIDTMRYALEHRQLDAAYRTNITCAKFAAAT